MTPLTKPVYDSKAPWVSMNVMDERGEGKWQNLRPWKRIPGCLKYRASESTCCAQTLLAATMAVFLRSHETVMDFVQLEFSEDEDGDYSLVVERYEEGIRVDHRIILYGV